jgi:hypothetical protein
MIRSHKTRVFLFDDLGDAHRAVARLLERGARVETLGLVTHDDTGQAMGQVEGDGRPERLDPLQTRTLAQRARKNGARGAVVGGLVGILGGLAALSVPGAGGVLVLGSMGGALAGGLFSAISTHFVHDGEAMLFEEALRRGGTLLFVHDASAALSGLDALMASTGATHLRARVAEWRAAGWSNKRPPEATPAAAQRLREPFEAFFLNEEPGAEDPWFKENWAHLRDPVVAAWPLLSVDDLRETDGHRGRLVSRICRLYDEPPDAVAWCLDELLARFQAAQSPGGRPVRQFPLEA